MTDVSTRVTTTAVSSTVHLLAGPAVNAAVLTDGAPGPGTPFTLVDAGYPGYAAAVRAAVEGLGLRWGDLAAVLVTHAHVDHVGALPTLLAGRADVPVLTGRVEAAHLRGETRESATPLDVLTRLGRYGVARWAAHIMSSGATAHVTWPAVREVADGVALDVPGAPVPLVVPGHTSGHTCYVVPGAEVLLSGDALVTGHPLSRVDGPQVLPGFFHHDVETMLASLSTIAAAPASALMPGHGPLWRGSLVDAVDAARARASATL